MSMGANAPSISVVITAHNEGAELCRTVDSVRRNTHSLAEIIVVDDGSEDGSSDGLASDLVRIIRHPRRIGVAYSRNEGSRAARGDVLCYLDGHQRVSRRCLDRCAQTAIDRRAITCPDVRNYGLLNWRLHGANFRMCPEQGYFSARWRSSIQWPGISTITALRAPPYLIPRALYPAVAWSPSLAGWGASEAAIVVKSFFAGIPILHLAGPLARHQFRKQFPYETRWDGIWRNHAIIARICFDDATWRWYWLPNIFESKLTEAARQAVESAEVQTEREEFARQKVRTDRQFWTELLRTEPPAGV